MEEGRSASWSSVVVGLVLAGLCLAMYDRDLDVAREHWRTAMAPHARTVRSRIEDQFRSIYEGLRTIARLPGVRDIDRYGTRLDADSRQAIQEIYNNLADRVQVSEVYILPRDFDPDAVDPLTGAPQEPVATFDEILIGRHADQQHPDRPEHHATEVPEIEIHEYRLMRRQLQEFRRRCPDEAAVDGLHYPALTGPEVITCDNRRYSPSCPDDKDRSGLVLSVPLFGNDGVLRGCVSGVLLTHAVRDVLPGGDYALHHAGHDYVAGSCTPGLWQHHLDDICADRPAPGVVYSEVLPVAIPDSEPGWMLWAARDDGVFLASAEAASARLMRNVLLLGSLLCTVGMLVRDRRLALRRREERQHRAELERARDAAESLSRTRANLLAVASHEIRTPLGGVIGMTDLLLDGELSPEQRTLAENANRSGRMLLDLLGAMLDFAKMESGQLTLEAIEFDLVDQVEGVVQLLAPAAAAKGIEFTLLLGDDLPPRAVGDPVRLRQLLTNLVGNAIKFTTQGAVTVCVDRFLLREGALLCMRVSDTGIGLDPAHRTRLFAPFTQADPSTTRRFGGTGLGLAISRGIVHAMGGEIDYLDTPGGGTTFVATLPLVVPSAAVAPPQPLRGLQVLVATARPRLAAMLRNDLTALGACVELAPSVAALPARAVTGRLPDIVLHEAAGIDAVAEAALARYLARRPDGRVVALHAWTAQGAHTAGGRAMVGVPASRRQLARALGSAAAPAPAAAAGASSPRAAAARGPVLVVDDNETNLRVATMALKKLGFTTAEARDGHEAIERVAATRFAFVLMDWQMPGMDGLEATRRIRAGERAGGSVPLPIIGVSANTFDSDRAACLEAGMDGFLPKPITLKSLAAAIAAVCPELLPAG